MKGKARTVDWNREVQPEAAEVNAASTPSAEAGPRSASATLGYFVRITFPEGLRTYQRPPFRLSA
ncbi:MAG TPA: hypothetical protein VNG33_12005, partial [Polyangiaceae bacterium]|nr:hypothetical protein [Polyangiaceae bacterium]